MTDTDREQYRNRLNEMAARLRGEVSALEGEALRPTGRALDEGGADADPGQADANEELALHLLGPAAGVLAEVEAALDRLGRGAFGACEACGRVIARPRLDALPYARRCVRCEAAAEINATRARATV